MKTAVRKEVWCGSTRKPFDDLTCATCGTKWSDNKPKRTPLGIYQCPVCDSRLSGPTSVIRLIAAVPLEEKEEGWARVQSELPPGDSVTKLIYHLFQEVLPFGRSIHISLADFGTNRSVSAFELKASIRRDDKWRVRVVVGGGSTYVNLQTKCAGRWITIQTDYCYVKDIVKRARDRIKKGFELNEFIAPPIYNHGILTSQLTHVKMDGFYRIEDGIWLTHSERGPTVPVLDIEWMMNRA